MELFRSGLKTVLGSAPASNGNHQDLPSGAETVEKLVERVKSSTLLEDRRDACRALRSLSRKYRVEVGAQGMDALLSVLSSDRGDSEGVSYALEALLNITSPHLLEDEESSASKSLGQEFTEILTKRGDNVALFLSLLEEYDFRVRLPAIRLLTNLLVNRPKDIQEVLLISPMGVSKVMDLLSDPREVVRNEAILLLIAVTKGNVNVQKIIAFENGFDRILEIIHGEGYSDGGPVVEDSLVFFLNLLRGNTSNQTLFREGNYIKKLVPFFSLPEETEGWPTQKVANVFHMLQILRTLVSPLNPAQITIGCQRGLANCGILECLCGILMASGVPAETLTETIVTVGELMRGSPEHQGYFSSLLAPSDPPRPALVILLMTLVNERQPLSLRCAVLYAVQCFLYKNEKTQGEVVKTLLPSSNENQSGLTAGQLICSGLFSKETSSNWFASLALAHAIQENEAQKENLLKVQLATRSNSPPITLLHHVMNAVEAATKPQVKIGLLQLLAVWVEACPKALSHFLSHSSAVPFLINQITSPESEEKELLVQGLSAFLMGLCVHFNPGTVENFNQEKLVELVTNRIGVDKLGESMSLVSKSEKYVGSLKHPEVIGKDGGDLLFDHSFALLFKKYENLVLLRFSDPIGAHAALMTHRRIPSNPQAINELSTPNDVLIRYKEMIRNQDIALGMAHAEVASLKNLNMEYIGKLNEAISEMSQLKSRLTMAEAFRESAVNVKGISESDHFEALQAKDEKIKQLEALLNSRCSGSGAMSEEVISRLEEENKALVEEVDRLKREQDDLLELLTEQDEKIGGLKGKLKDLGHPVQDDGEDELLNEPDEDTNFLT